MIASCGLQLLWQILHLFVSFVHFVMELASAVESIIGPHKKYEAFSFGKIKSLAVVVESEEAHNISRLVQLLTWLRASGANHISLYDAQGVMKKSEKAIVDKLNNVQRAGEDDKLRSVTLEFTSFSDGKEAVVKAANLLFGQYMQLANLGEEQRDKIFTEIQMADALKTIGSDGPEPDLLLVYGPVRCHLGFPAWRIRYTEILHMGSLASMKYGSFAKALYKFTMVRQNYGK